MVATRRGARTGPSEETEPQDTSMMLRKKPVRRATTKTTQTAPPAPAPTTTRGRAMRSGDNEPAPAEDATETTDCDVPAKQQKPVAKRATRSRKAESAAPEQSEVSEVEQTAPKVQRGRKKATVEPSAPVPEVADEQTPKSSLAARPTRPTRAKDPAPKPLSPKKITQVTRPRTRNTKATDTEKQKQPAKPQQMTTAALGRTTRKRTVSDENADVPELVPTDNEKSEPTEPPSLLAKPASPRKPSPAKEHADESEGSMSSRGTTPSHSPEPTFEQPKDYTEDNVDAEVSDNEDEETEVPHVFGSEDELCGPKTPMKRSVHHQGPKFYASAQKTARRVDPEVPTDTPPRRYGAKRRARATPQTQKPVTRAASHKSKEAPRTVAHGNGGAFERKPLSEEVTDMQQVSDEEVMIQSDVEGSAEVKEPAAEQDNEPAEPAEIDITELASDDKPKVQTDGQDEEDHTTNASPRSEHADPDETILVSDDEDETEVVEDSPTVRQDTMQLEQDEDPMVIDDDEQPSDIDSEDEDLEDSLFAFNAKTPKPETINWENLRQDNTIAVDFDFYLADVRSPPKDGSTPGMTGFRVEQQAEAGAGQEVVYDSVGDMIVPDQPTMTLTDFIDVAALAETTLRFDPLAADISIADARADHVDADRDGEETEDPTIIGTEFPEIASEDLEIPAAESDECQESVPASPSVEEEIDVLAVTPKASDLSSESSKVHLDDTPTQVDAVNQSGAEDGTSEDQEHDQMFVELNENVPHYAFPTLASRRKSLPAISYQTPVRSGSRPTTSDGASIARLSRPFDQSFWLRHAEATADKSDIRAAATPHRLSTSSSSPARKISNTAQVAHSSAFPAHATPIATPRERFPRLAARENYEDFSQTVAAPARFQTPRAGSAKRHAVVQRLGSQQGRAPAKPSAPSTPTAASQGRVLRSALRGTPGLHAQTAAAPARFRTPVPSAAQCPATVQRLASQSTPEANPSPVRPISTRKSPAKLTPATAAPQHRSTGNSTPVVATPIPVAGARYPRLAPREKYEEHASTVAAPARFRTPGQTAMKRPQTTQRPTDMRKVAFKPSTPRTSHTPVKTPLKAPDMTPGNVPMTPHPAAPLRGVTALVEVFTLDGASASAPFTALLRRLGAKTTKTWSDRVTHVVFKDGSPTTLQRVRLQNKEVEAAGKGSPVHCVNSRWVSDCDADGSRVDETDEAYAVDVTDVPRGGSRRRKSMEPNALINLGGNIVRDRKSSFGRKNSVGRSSLGRSSLKFESPEKKAEVLNTPVFGKENGEDFDDDDDFATPEYLKSPGKLVQQTAPINRVKKLNLNGEKADGKNRRLTFWSSGN